MLINDVKHLKAEYVKFHLKGVEVSRMLFLCLLIEHSGLRFPKRLAEKVDERLEELAAREGRATKTLLSQEQAADRVDSIDDLSDGSMLLYVQPDSWQGAFKTCEDHTMRYNRRIYFLDQWIKELENGSN